MSKRISLCFWLVLLMAAPLRAEPAKATDEIVIKSVNAIIFEMKANLKLTKDQEAAVRPIITDNVVSSRNLQLSLENGTIDGKAMYDQRQQLTNEENSRLSAILSPDQLKLWVQIENE